MFGASTIGAPTELGIASVRMQGALDMLAVKYPVLRAQVALLFQQWNVEQLCKLADHEKWSEPIHKYQYIYLQLETGFGYCAFKTHTQARG